jgi:hypothetical protein
MNENERKNNGWWRRALESALAGALRLGHGSLLGITFEAKASANEPTVNFYILPKSVRAHSFLVLVLLESRSLRPDGSEDERRSIPQAVPEIFKTYELDHSHPVGAHMLLEKARSNPGSYSSD